MASSCLPLPYMVIGLVTILVYYNSLTCDFTFDDNSAVVSNRHVHTNETDWWSVFSVDYWGTPIRSEHSHKSYRPLTLLTFRFNYLFSGLKPYGYHLTNVLLHALVSIVCYRFMMNILDDHWPSLLLTLFFAVHPLKSEAVAGIVGRAELLSTLLFLTSIFCYFDSVYSCFVFHATLATLSKEQSLTVPLVCMSYELFNLYIFYKSMHGLRWINKLHSTIKHSSLIRAILLFIFTIILAIIRFYVMGALPVFTKFDNPASFEATPTRQLTYNYLLPLNAMLMLYPKHLCADWTMNSIPLVREWRDHRNLSTVAFYLVLFMLMVRAVIQLHSNSTQNFKTKNQNRKICLAFALCLTIFPFIPASNLLFPVGFVIAERVLYTPSIGYCFILAIGLIRIRDFFRNKWVTSVLYVFTLLTIIALSMRTFERNFDWKNDFTLFNSGLKVNPNNAKLYNNIGHYYERNSRYMDAIEYFKQAAVKDPEDIGSELNIARALIKLNRIDEAETLLWRIKPRVRNSAIRNRIVPSYLNLWINLAQVISMNNSRLNEAENLYREVISIRRGFVDAYINLGEIYIRRSQLKEAIEIYQEALSRAEYKNDLKAADLFYNIAIARTLQLANDSNMEQNNSFSLDVYRPSILREIAGNFVLAIDINSNHKEALINLAILVQKPDFPEENRTHYREYVLKALQAYTKNEEQEVIEFNIAITLLDLGGLNNRMEAIQHLKRAVQIKPNFRSALYNLALLYYDFKDYTNALHYLQQINEYHSNYAKALLLMADIFSKLKQMDRAEQAYIKVLETDNVNYEALHNLYQIYKLNHRLDRFKKYLPRLSNPNQFPL
ncbi:hypothetical protein RDWZM_007474 [Blomia tropicalis]|uniref:dolichyl-phosphate-mannose--protein mannosyltransferase n=1 Tax=Blomia tropicalis TaxID=40697 RepID=A0A9Q0M2P1_BLOTA|nr:hypothetical protein RDWZM_007474 [Blomia tropicalis]